MFPSSFRSSTAFSSSFRTSSVPGDGNVTLLTHILPLMPGSFKDALCCLERGVGSGESRMDLSILIINSVLRSHFDDVGESQSECHTAVLNRKGTFGITIRAIPAGDASMMECGTQIVQERLTEQEEDNRVQEKIGIERNIPASSRCYLG